MSQSDVSLLKRAQDGDSEAFVMLWKRHSEAARWAAHLISPEADLDDVVQETFTRLFASLQEHKARDISGPFRQYVYVTVRQVIESSTVPSTVPLNLQPHGNYFASFTDDLAERSLISSAYAALSEEWRSILWYTEIEQLTPVEVAPLLGLSPNAVAALAYRAREGLRAAWLQAHVRTQTIAKNCDWTVSHLGTFTRGTLSPKKAERVSTHLRTCDSCAALFAEVNNAAKQLRSIALFATLGVTLAPPLVPTAGALLTVTGTTGAWGSGVATSNAFAATAMPMGALPIASGASAGTVISFGATITSIGAIAASLVLGTNFAIPDKTSQAPRALTSVSETDIGHGEGTPQVQQSRGFFGQSAHFVASGSGTHIEPNLKTELSPVAAKSVDTPPSAASAANSLPSETAGARQNDRSPGSRKNELESSNSQSPRSKTVKSPVSVPSTSPQSAPSSGSSPTPSSPASSPSSTAKPSSSPSKTSGFSSSPTGDDSDSPNTSTPTPGNTADGQSPADGPATEKTDPDTDNTTSEPDESASEGSEEGDYSVFTAEQVNLQSSGPPYFSGNGPQVALIEVIDEYGALVGSVRIGHDYNWGLRVSDTYTSAGLTSMTYQFYLTDGSGNRSLARTLTVTGLTP